MFSPVRKVSGIFTGRRASYVVVQGPQRMFPEAQAKLARFYDLSWEVPVHHFYHILVKRIAKASPDSSTKEFNSLSKNKALGAIFNFPYQPCSSQGLWDVTLKTKHQVIKIFQDIFKNRALRRPMFWPLRTFLTFFVISGIRSPT